MSKSLYTTIVEAFAPTTETVGVVGQLYLDTSVPTLYQCTAVESSVYTWTALGGVSQEDFDKLVNNETSIRANSVTKSFLAGSPMNSSAERAIQIGYLSKAGFCGVGIGYEAEGAGTNSVGLGYGAKAKNNNNIQLGQGTNTKSNTLQIFDKNIYNHSTDTLTVQNIELNGEDLATKLENAGGSAGGNAKKYLHRINCWDSGDGSAPHINFEFIDDNNASYTTIEEIRSALYNCGVISKATMIKANGYYGNFWVSGLYVTSTQFTLFYNSISTATKSITLGEETFKVYTSVNRSASSNTYTLSFDTIADNVVDLAGVDVSEANTQLESILGV